MRRLLTAKQEAFCLAYIETGNASEAYRRAYSASRMKPTTVNREANALFENHNITTRLDELRQPAIEKAQVTLEGHLNDLKELRDAAKEAEQFSAAIAAEVARGKAAGVHVEKTETKHSGAIGAPELNVYVNGVKSESDPSPAAI
jgi:phage terminase small subunit